MLQEQREEFRRADGSESPDAIGIPDRVNAEFRTKPAFRNLLPLLAAVLIGLAQVLLLGYQLGVGNQGIQIAILKHWASPQLFAADGMVIGTTADYPSFFFRLLAPLLGHISLPELYMILHLATAGGLFLALWFLARSMFGRTRGGFAFIVLAGLLLFGHHRALGGDDLYSPGFTHTWAVLPLAVAVLAMLYRGGGWTFAAMLLTGLTFNLHALTAAYLAAIAMCVVAADWRQLTGLRLAGLLAALLLPMWPTLASMAAHRHVFDEAWVMVTRVRSADHSFPSSWWVHGSPDIPRYLLILALAALAWAWPMPPRTRRVTVAVALATLLLCVAGFVFSEIHPLAAVLRAQLFRSTRLLLIVALAHIAHGIASALVADDPHPNPPPAYRGREKIELAVAAITLLVVALPPLTSWLAAAVVLGIVVALINGRLHWISAGIAAAAVGIAILAQQQLGVAMPPLGGPAWAGWPALRHFGPAAADDWEDVQKWAKANTRASAVILTPPQRSGFRIHSDRAIVGEWRDGTQAYFSPDFAQQWLKTMHTVQSGMLVDRDAGLLVSRGADIGTLSDDKILEVCQLTGASHVVLPAGNGRQLRRLYANGSWAVYAAEVVRRPPATNPAEAQDRFLAEVVRPNIEKYRKGDLTIQVVDDKGRPLAGAKFEARQTSSDFNFGCSLPFFKQPPRPRGGDFYPPQVTQAELDRFLELFNASTIPFSSKWMYLEPTEGQRQYDDLDAYIEFCTKNKVRPEFHFVSGYVPAWMIAKPREQKAEQQAAAFLRHARQLAERYGDRIRDWQVVNERVLFEHSAPVYRELRRLMPDARLGLSNCAKFGSDRRNVGDRTRDMYQGLEEIKSLKKEGIQLDFFAFHGHRPLGWWMDARQMYECLDTFAAEGVRLHISEFTVPTGRIGGPVRSGQWTPELQAEFYEFYYSVCFSHPAVDAINLWGIGPATWQEGSGLLDAKFAPKPAFLALKKLITETWRTRAEGTLGIDGSGRFRGFHGEYELLITLPDGAQVRGSTSIHPSGQATARFQLDEAGTTLTPAR